MNDNKKTHCSFCGAAKEECDHLVAGIDGAHICNKCPSHINDFFVDNFGPQGVGESNAENLMSDSKFADFSMKPIDIYGELSRTIVGQDKAKKAISSAVYSHYKKISVNTNGKSVLNKSNIWLIGRTGTGKTMFARALAEMLDLPFVKVDATALTESGYTGDDVESIIGRLLQSADGDVEKAQKGIVYIDEVDKLRKMAMNLNVSRDVSGEGVQQALLTMIEGTVLSVPTDSNRKHPNSKSNIQFDTKNVLFIVGGSFAGIEELLINKQEKGIGFGANVTPAKEQDVSLSDVGNSELIKFGMIAEFVARFPVKVALDDMTLDSLKRIIQEPEGSIVNQYKELFAMDSVELEVSDSAIHDIAHKALLSGTGARAAQEIFESKLADAMFEVPSMPDVEAVLLEGESVLYRKKEKVAA
tara:strand:- start:1004 stop:2248 length:1245 start_codon:yes stop_codon:yes gene_type:complete